MLYNLRTTLRSAFFGKLSEILQTAAICPRLVSRYFSEKKDFYRRLYLNADIDVAIACVAKRARGVPLGFTTFEQ